MEQIDQQQLQQWLPQVCKIALQAGRCISRMYRENQANEFIDVDKKKDGTPVTEADRYADGLIFTALQSMTPDIPLVTEESVAKFSFDERQHWSTYWLVDPLDGTKEFIEGTGEFSVNIALIHHHKPVLGVVFGPEVNHLYYAIQGNTSYKVDVGVQSNDVDTLDIKALLQQARAIRTANLAQEEITKVAVSRRHGGRTQYFMSELGAHETVKMGSALKSCLVAEGAAHVYPRFGPTSLWDTAASQIIVEMAGGAVLNAAGHPLEYVQTPTLLNPFFLVVCQTDYSWPPIPEVM
ncbi:3'(2'),5'-bisphosphate nucleotidase CysQ [Thiomicrorhabdus sp. 6S2-11]|jgi:3'(2'), 5'-bisphosphate nucleotidase|uniref:3'(2'),5'-bisphosphate nucleotidase CysQ n=1 Tax=Thiomicrorhabdus marina TaxID=2818442 RepID=A0ABS3Q6E2_9GAMM|nr:3'(2'),5'-bisphosphate nucleotidase CysQ [Thiomicrorhabdus marina]MBO1927926.1 3'(2'),5'-bisphosphate nucleotidase CysQ [Thiomicrorhabdus marina]